ncbi:MAG: hypothetical protein E3J72_09705 [Planctomycetota bacterium]|nr:MAG: hypothetical protein E3J72_09705 [Planctomycetota bacterium]
MAFNHKISLFTLFRGILAVLVLFLSFLLFPLQVLGDTIHLRNGRTLKGEIISENSEEVTIKIGTIEVTITRAEINRIERGKTEPKDTSVDKKADFFERGKEKFKAGEYREAAKLLRRAKQKNIQSEELDRMLTFCDSINAAENGLKKLRLKEAKEAANKVLELEPENAAAKEILEEIAGYDKIIAEKGSLPGDFIVFTSKHFEIHHHQPYIGSIVAEDAEKHFEFLYNALRYEGCPRPKFKKKFIVRIYRNHKEFVDAVGDIGRLFPALTTSKTEIAASQGVIINTFKHEITHCMTHEILPSMPVWIHEGLATGGYQRAKAEGYGIAKKCLDAGRFLPFDEFLKIRTMDKMRMSANSFYFESRMAVEFIIFAKGGMKKFHKFAKRVRELMVKDANAYAKQQGKSVNVRNVDFLEKPVRKMLEKMYGYGDLKKFDTDLKKYILSRLKTAKYQESQQHRKLTAKWKYTLRLDSEHFALFTTSDKKTAQPLLDLSEKTYETFCAEFTDTGMLITGKMKIYLFDKKSEYAAFLKKSGSKISQGTELVPHYSPYSGAACVFRQGNSKEYLHQTTVHEVVHGLSLSLMKSFYGSGCWTVEGITHYVALSANWKKKTIKLGEIHQTKKSQMTGYLKTMRKEGKVLPLKKLISMSQPQLARITSHVQAWSFFHFLQHGKKGKYKEGLHNYLAAICSGKPADVSTFEKLVGKLSEIEPAYQAYIKKLKPNTNLKRR